MNQQGHRSGDDSSRGGDPYDLVIDVLHNLRGFRPYICGIDRLWKEKTMPQRQARSSFFGLAGDEKPDYTVRGVKKHLFGKGSF